jgi:MSHA biogenesis protein MshK
MRPWLFVFLSVAAGAATAAPFADPTRPPGALDGERAGPAGGPRLESILIAPDRRVAVISGQEVTVGSRIGDGEVVRITEDSVLIRKPDGEASLKLFPGEAKRPAATKGK